MNPVTLSDGQIVDSSSEAWRAECEARYILSLSMPKRVEQLALITFKRGIDATNRIRKNCYVIEPHYVLGMPNKAQRNDYLKRVRERYGEMAAETLRVKVLELHSAR